jgi:hypothetical protein
MDNSEAMDVGQSLRDACTDGGGITVCERSALQTLGERWALDELHDEPGARQVLGLVDTCVEQGDQMRVVEAGKQLGLGREPLAIYLPASCAVHDLDRNLATQGSVETSVDLGHASLSDESAQLIAVVDGDGCFVDHGGEH